MLFLISAVVRPALRSRSPFVRGLVSPRNYSTSGLYTWRQRLWYRPDGTRRSKLKGGIYAFAVSTSLLLCTGAVYLQREHELVLYLAKLQEIDSRYSIDESSPLSDVVAYISELDDALSFVYPEVASEYLQYVAEAHRVFSQTSPEHHERVRRIFADVHKIFVEGAGEHPFTEGMGLAVIERLEEFRKETFKLQETIQTILHNRNAGSVVGPSRTEEGILDAEK